MRFVLVISALLTLIPQAIAAVPAEDLVNAGVATESWTDTTPKPRDAGQFRTVMVEAHNRLRERFGVPALSWDESLAADAKAYAETLARTQRFRHAAQTDTDAVQGENLWMGTRTAYDYAEMTGAWIEEGAHVRPGRFPEVSTTGSWHDVGHFTQMVWGDTQRLGCAIAANAEDEVLVCRYFPAGNVMGEDMLASRPTELAAQAALPNGLPRSGSFPRTR